MNKLYVKPMFGRITPPVMHFQITGCGRSAPFASRGRHKDTGTAGKYSLLSGLCFFLVTLAIAPLLERPFDPNLNLRTIFTVALAILGSVLLVVQFCCTLTLFGISIPPRGLAGATAHIIRASFLALFGKAGSTVSTIRMTPVFPTGILSKTIKWPDKSTPGT